MTLTSFRGWLVIPMVLLGLVGACSLAEAGQTRPDASLYAEGTGWSIIAERKQRACTIILPFGERQILMRLFRPKGGVKYSIMFWKKVWSPRKTHYDYEIRNERGFLYRADALSYEAANGNGSVALGLFDEKLLKDILSSRVLYVKSDGVSEEPYSIGDVRPGLRRYLDCVREMGEGKPRPSPPPKTRRMN